ncbi:CDP-glycerol glycerophosphotransferase family protein [Enterococcus faecalis]|uniref:CDP-glycerol glycerophosphotransferase family protein n=1 Tax=Enterococcus faecalis TaxID=1351 RepID=UPI003DA0162D
MTNKNHQEVVSVTLMSDRKIKIYFELSNAETICTIALKKRRSSFELALYYELIEKNCIIVTIPKEIPNGRYDAVFKTYDNIDVPYGINSKNEFEQNIVVSDDTKAVAMYKSLANKLSFYVNTWDKVLCDRYNIVAKVVKVSIKIDGTLKMISKLHCATPFEIKGMYFKLRGTDNINYTTKMKVRKNSITASMDVSDFDWEQFYWDAYVMVSISGFSFNVRVTEVNFRTLFSRTYFPGTQEFYFPDGHVLYPYVTYAGGLSLNYRKKTRYETGKYLRNTYIATILYLCFGWVFKYKKIWLIHEKFSQSAQDNSYYFFNYCYEMHHDKLVYYVIAKDSPDIQKLNGKSDRTILFMSIKHQFYLMISNLIISSESKGHGYAWRANQGLPKIKLNQKKYVFLQHGVIGFKRLDNTFKAGGVNHANLFISSSDMEKDIIVKELNYSTKEVVVTGLARWDSVRKDKPEKIILYMPTWRTWLDEVSDKEFTESMYYQDIQGLLQDMAWDKLLTTSGTKLIFYVHPKFFDKFDLFDVDRKTIEFVKFGEQSLKDIISKASMLITDYSSVAWDFLYQKKPVIFYQFDRALYDEFQGSYIDFEKYAFGPIVSYRSELFSEVEKKINSNYEDFEIEKYQKEYFKFIDINNRQRIYCEIVNYLATKSTKKSIRHELSRKPLARYFYKKYKPIYKRLIK